MSLADQYHLAGEHYEQLNEFSGEVQRDIFDGEWLDTIKSPGAVPMQGGVLGRAPAGATNENSYYFTAERWYSTTEDLDPVIVKAAEAWDSWDWDVSEYSSELSGNPRVQAATPEGYYFQLKEGNDELRLTGSSPVYWANLDELQDAVVQRLDAEDAAGTVTWDATDRDDDDVGRRMPGEYPDFPAGDS